MMRPCPGLIGKAPRIQTLRSPFLRRMVVRVAVVTPARIFLISASVAIDFAFSSVGLLDACDHAAVDADHAPGDEGCALAGEKCDNVAVFLGFPVPPDRDGRRAFRGNFLH